MAIEVRIPTILRTYTGGEKAVDGAGRHARRADRRPRGQPPRHQGAAGRRTATCAASSTSTSTTRTSGSPAGSDDRGQRRRPGRRPAGRRRRLSRPADALYDNLLDSVGGTPLVGLPTAVAVARRAALGQARGPQPDRLDQGPRRAGDGRARRRRTALLRPGCTILEPTSRQHRHLAGDGRQAQGLPAGLRDAREHLRGAPPAAADVGRRDRRPRPPPAAPTRRSGSPSRSPRSTPTG